MQKSPKQRDRPVIPLLKDETSLIGVILSSIGIVVIALLLDSDDIAMIAILISTAASCIAFAAVLTAVLRHREARQSLQNPILAASWLAANSVILYLIAGVYILQLTLALGFGLSVVLLGFYFLGLARSKS